MERSGDGGFLTVDLAFKRHPEHFKPPFSSFFFDCKTGEGDFEKVLCFPSCFLRKYWQYFYKVTLIHGDQVGKPSANDKWLKVHRGQNISMTLPSSLGVCVKPFHYRFDRALWLVEFVEFYKLLGFEIALNTILFPMTKNI